MTSIDTTCIEILSVGSTFGTKRNSETKIKSMNKTWLKSAATHANKIAATEM
jgi:hypothetical protein